MKTASHRRPAGFTLIEILLALAIFILVVTAIYSSWTTILRASKSGMAVAAQVQSERMAIHIIEDALTSVQSFAWDPQNHYYFNAENGSEAWLSFAARLPKSFPRHGRWGDLDVRRVTFWVERGSGSLPTLKLRQYPILMEPDEYENTHPLELASPVKEFKLEYWDLRKGWDDDWSHRANTNQVPPLIKVTLRLADPNQRYSSSRHQEEVIRIIAPPSITVPGGPNGPNMGRP